MLHAHTIHTSICIDHDHQQPTIASVLEKKMTNHNNKDRKDQYHPIENFIYKKKTGQRWKSNILHSIYCIKPFTFTGDSA